MKKQLTVTEAEAGLRLDVVASELTGLTRSQIHKLFSTGGVLADGDKAKPSQISETGQILEIEIPPAKQSKLIPPDTDPKIIYEDENILAIDKPAGLAVHPTESDRPQATVAGYAKKIGVDGGDLERPGIVHRLDKDTSGVLLLAKNLEAKAYLQKLFKERLISKTYVALVSGRLKDPEATIKLPIGRNPRVPTKRTVIPGARAAVTHYRVVKEFPGASLLEVDLETGRTHQIRVHFSHLGHPVVGDVMYGAKPAQGLDRQFLHASQVKFELPDGQEVIIQSPLPADLAGYLEKLEREL